ncbi:uncharacterized protein TNCV_2887241 [Trichonephila clavipes]|nr:uncharacterized protein TNCV_2887241 [Trichonephila clavipes]
MPKREVTGLQKIKISDLEIQVLPFLNQEARAIRMFLNTIESLMLGLRTELNSVVQQLTGAKVYCVYLSLRDLKRWDAWADVPAKCIDDFSFVPRFPCDKFDEISRSCINNRQIGTTLTVGVRLDTKDEKNLWKKYVVRWFRYFKVLNSENDIKEELTVDKMPQAIHFLELIKKKCIYNMSLLPKENEVQISSF